MNKKHSEGEATQLPLELKESKKNKFYKLKGEVDKKIRYTETHRIFRNPWIWLTVTFAISLTAVQIIYLYNNISILPTEIPLFEIFTTPKEKLAPQKYLYIIPLISTAIILINSVTGFKLYNRKPEITIFSFIVMLSSISLLTFVVLRLLAQYYV